jgi:membrane fusion protein, copper/silver efflux system
MKRFFLILFVAAVAGVGGWYAGRAPQTHSEHSTGGRKVLFYQSPMHPWIKSEKPGNCTICGMKLTPIYEGDKPFEAEGDVVQIGTNSVTVLNVRTAEVTKQLIKRTIRAAGTIEEDETRRRIISAYVAGRIDELHFNFVGAEVKGGVPLATFFSPDLLAAEREFSSLLGRSTDQGLISAAALRLKRLGLNDLQIANLSGKKAESQQSEILAPIGGTIVNRFVYPGQYVMEGEKLFEIADFSKMWLLANVYEQDLAWVREGQTVRVTAAAVPGKEFAGKVAFISPSLDAMTRSAVARIELENPLVDGKRVLWHRLYAEAIFENESGAVLSVDRAAVLNPGGQPFVYVDLGSGAFEKHPVQLGRRGDAAWEVLEGVDEGDKVVLDGNFLIDSQAQLKHGGGAHEHSEHGGHP